MKTVEFGMSSFFEIEIHVLSKLLSTVDIGLNKKASQNKNEVETLYAYTNVKSRIFFVLTLMKKYLEVPLLNFRVLLKSLSWEKIFILRLD